MIGTILGWSGFGLAARFWQLGILKRNLFENPGGHAISMGVWGGFGYLYYNWNQRVTQMLEEKKAALREGRAAGATASASEEDSE